MVDAPVVRIVADHPRRNRHLRGDRLVLANDADFLVEVVGHDDRAAQRDLLLGEAAEHRIAHIEKGVGDLRIDRAKERNALLAHTPASACCRHRRPSGGTSRADSGKSSAFWLKASQRDCSSSMMLISTRPICGIRLPFIAAMTSWSHGGSARAGSPRRIRDSRDWPRARSWSAAHHSFSMYGPVPTGCAIDVVAVGLDHLARHRAERHVRHDVRENCSRSA